MSIISIFYTITMLLLYECSASKELSLNFQSFNPTYSNVFNSNTFISNTFISNTFISNTFISNAFISNTFISNALNSKSINYKTNSYLTIISQYQKISMNYYSHSISVSIKNTLSWNQMLSIIQTISTKSSSRVYSRASEPYIAPTLSPILAPIETALPTMSPYIMQFPTQFPSLPPTSLPTLNFKTAMPTSFASTYMPTFVDTFAPTHMPTFVDTFTPVMSFTTDLTLSNVQTNFLDLEAQQSVIIATANSMNISIDFVTFVSSSIFKDQILNQIKLLSFNLIATTKTSIPLKGKYSTFASDPISLFTSLSTTMNTALTNGAFTNYLVTASIQLNSTATSAASVSSISIFAPIVEINGTTLSPTSRPTQNYLNGHVTKKKNFYYLFLYLSVSCISVFLLVYFIEIFRKYLKKKEKMKRNTNISLATLAQTNATNEIINATNEIINAEDIQILIVNNN